MRLAAIAIPAIVAMKDFMSILILHTPRTPGGT
jgi:hypothetical protein